MRERHNSKIGRNDPCPCGSKLKFKKCCGKQDRQSSEITVIRMAPEGPGMYRHPGKGRRDYVFAALPDELKDPMKVCSAWVDKELCSRGMACEITLMDTKTGQQQPMFSCPIFEVTKDGMGDEIPEWGTAEFFDRIKKSFEKAINDALEKSGLSRSYDNSWT